MILRGTDVSQFQPHVDWRQLVVDGLGAFSYAKCTENTGVDPMHSSHVYNARAAGVPIGSYCFGHPSHDVKDSVDAFLKHAALEELRPMLDLESLMADNTVPPNAADWGDEWSDRVKFWFAQNRPDTQTAKRGPFVYSFLSFFREIIKKKATAFGASGWDKWLSLPNGATQPNVGFPYLVHQYACNVAVKGQIGLWDLDALYADSIEVLRV